MIEANRVGKITAEAGKVAAEAAVESNKIASDTAKIQPSGLPWHRGLRRSIANPTAAIATVTFRIKNYGQTPRHSIRIGVADPYLIPFPSSPPVPDEKQIVWLSGDSVATFAGPGHTVPTKFTGGSLPKIKAKLQPGNLNWRFRALSLSAMFLARIASFTFSSGGSAETWFGLPIGMDKAPHFITCRHNPEPTEPGRCQVAPADRVPETLAQGQKSPERVIPLS